MGKVQSEYNKLHYEIAFSGKKWKKKAFKEAYDRREELWSELRRRVNDAWWKKDHPAPSYSYSAPAPSPSSSSSSSTQTQGSYQHLTGVDIMNNYDKKLSFGNYFATAYGKTAPNGTERWVLMTEDGKEAGTFSKVEFVEASGIDQYILVRDDNGQWGIYSRAASLMCDPQFESIKMLKATTFNGEEHFPRAFFDVTKRDAQGILRHGLFNPNWMHYKNGEYVERYDAIPCEYDQIEMIDDRGNPSLTDEDIVDDGYGILAKVRRDGKSGIIEPYNRDVVLPAEYSYVNTYYTLKKGRYLIVGDGNQLGAYYTGTMPMEEVVPVTVGYSLDKVKQLIEEWEKSE